MSFAELNASGFRSCVEQKNPLATRVASLASPVGTAKQRVVLRAGTSESLQAASRELEAVFGV